MALTIKAILVPTDFSDCSEGALDYAVALATQFKAALHLVHVSPIPSLAAAAMDGVIVSLPELEAEMRTAAEAEMARLVARISGVPVSTEIAVGNPPTCIVTVASERGVDLIVMGTHGRGPLMHLMLGSVAERVVRLAPCPVLTTRQPKLAATRPAPAGVLAQSVASAAL
jgi:universal stress protein A